MKKALKIIGISLACLVGIVLLAAVIALSTVTSPKQLTKMVKKHAPSVLPFDLQLERAKLTIVKTFPDVGLELDRVAILSPMEGSPSDTLARVDKLILSADAKHYLKTKEIVVNRCQLQDSRVVLFTDADGRSNLDIFKSQEEDTTSTPFDLRLDLQQVNLKNTDLTYIDRRNGLHGEATGLDLDLQGRMADDDITAVLALKAPALQLQTGGLQGTARQLEIGFDGRFDDYNRLDGDLTLASPGLSLVAGYEVLHDDQVRLSLPLTLALDTLAGSLHDARVALNEMQIDLPRGTFRLDDPDLVVDAAFHTNPLDIEAVLALLPEKVVQSLQGIRFTGTVQLTDGQVSGIVNDSLLPVISADVAASDAVIAIPQLPYPFKETELHTHFDLDLNDSLNARDVVLNTTWGHTKLQATGALTDLARKMALDVALDGNLPLADLKPFLPKDLGLKGKADVKLKTQGRLDYLMAAVTQYRFDNRLRADARVTLRDFAFDMDTLHAVAPKLNLELDLPAARRVKGRSGAYIALTGETLRVKGGNTLQADLRTLALRGNADRLDKGLEALLANADLDLAQLDLVYDTVTVHANRPALTVETRPGKRNGLHANVTLKTEGLEAAAGSSYHFDAHALAVGGTVDQDKGKPADDWLHHWNPSADFVLTQAKIRIPQLDKTIQVPTIDFVADARELGFRKGGIKLGRSDLMLEGNVLGIDQWLANNAQAKASDGQVNGTAPHHDLVKAELQVRSNYLDLNEIMDLTSGLGTPADSLNNQEVANKEDNPFMVPKGVDVTFNIHANKAIYRNLELNNLGGTATIKDGTLLLREIGFTNEAAEMQLTAIYQSPRKNHLFLGFDFHLLDVQIHDLLHIIPEIDTIVPMLKTFDGAAEFHIAAQTNLKSNYDLKMSTLRASADIEGANLSVRDIASFTKITDMLKVSTNGEYRIDSIDIQMTAFRDEVDLWPFQVSIGKYKATLDGHYNLNTVGQYHISVTESPLPTRLGLKISGPLDNLSYSLEPCKYPNLYKPARRNDTEQLIMQLKQQIAQKLKENVQ
jgi:hypothetical protein